MAHYPLDVLPDPSLAVLEYLRSVPQVLAQVADAEHILTQIPENPSYPYILVQQAGGRGMWPALDKPTIQIDALGGDQPTCNTIARTVRAAIWAIANDITAAGVLVEGADEVAPAWIPDMSVVPPISRYTARYSVILH